MKLDDEMSSLKPLPRYSHFTSLHHIVQIMKTSYVRLYLQLKFYLIYFINVVLGIIISEYLSNFFAGPYIRFILSTHKVPRSHLSCRCWISNQKRSILWITNFEDSFYYNGCYHILHVFIIYPYFLFLQME